MSDPANTYSQSGQDREALRLGIITDEVSDDPHEACRLIAEWGLSIVELRTAWGKNLLELSDEELQEVESAVRSNGLEVVGIASPVFKSPLDEQPREQEADFALEGVETMSAQLELLERACVLAERFGAGMVRVFTFWRQEFTDEVLADLVAKLGRGAAVAQRHGLVLAVENEPVCIVGTGPELARLFAALERDTPPALRPSLGILWDPGNAYALGDAETFPAGYQALEPKQIVHVHLKDLKEPGTRTGFVPLGEGTFDYRGQLRNLLADGYRGDLVLEPHYRPAELTRADAAKACVDAAAGMLREVVNS